MARSDHLSRLAARAKQAETRVAAVREEARSDVEKESQGSAFCAARGSSVGTTALGRLLPSRSGVPPEPMTPAGERAEIVGAIDELNNARDLFRKEGQP
jgi:hypothetical protein